MLRRGHRRVRVFGEEECELTRRDGKPGAGLVAEEDQVLLLVVFVLGVMAIGQRFPSDDVDACESELDIDVTPMRFESRTLLARRIDQGGVQPLAVDFVPPDGEVAQIRSRQPVPCHGDARMQATVALYLRKAIENHALFP